MADQNVASNFSFSLKDVGKSSRHVGGQDKAIKRSEMPEVNILYL